MVTFYDTYFSPIFADTVQKFITAPIVQSGTAKLESHGNVSALITPNPPSEIVQFPTAQLAQLLALTTFTNHVTILNLCHSMEERLFYIIYAHRERLKNEELVRCIETDTFTSLLGTKKNMSKGLLEAYPNAPVIFKDTTFVDYLGLPQKHSETKLRKELIANMKKFILDLGKDFLFMDEEYVLPVGASKFKADLLFYHRGLQCLVAVELKKTKFHPRDLGQLEFYLEALDRDVRRTNENPSIGLILCPNSDEKVVEYAMSRSMSPALVTEYKRLLIPKEKMQTLLAEYCQFAGLEKNRST